MKKLILLMLCFVSLAAMAQDEYTFKFLSQINQSSFYNASNKTDAKISVGLPMLSSNSFYLYNNGFTYHDLIKKVDDTTAQLQLGNVIDKLKNKNYIGFGSSLSLFSFNYAKQKFSVGFSVNERMMFQFNYPGDLLKLIWNGNGNYLGQNLEIGNFEVNLSYYREYATHFTYKYKKWQFGASPKILFGKANINTAQSSITLLTDPTTFKLSTQANFNVQTSGFPDSTERKNAGVPTVKNYIFNTANKGFAIDLGATYQYNEKLKITVGINDLGSIKWKSRTHNYTMTNARVDFEGVNVADMVDSNSTISQTKLVDSLKNIFKYKTNEESYKTRLPLSMYAMATYELSKHHSFGAQLTTNTFHANYISALTLFYQLKLSKHFSASMSYTNKSNSPFNLGGGIVVQLLGMQTYFVTDNWWAAVKPLDSKNANFRFGMNIVIGNAKTKKDNTPTPIMTEEKKEPTLTQPTPATEPKK
ncbi:MAG: hypothetical protein RJA07_154 [Bacteroidota bacterium]|jgi:hypothetical protein